VITSNTTRALRCSLAVSLIGLVIASCSTENQRSGTRVVCVSKQINEFLYAIGAESVLVARDLTSIYPPQITKLPSVGYHRALSAEGIVSMRPTMLLTDGNLGPEAVVNQVKQVGIPVVIMTPGGTPDSAQLLMTRLGQQFHHERGTDSVIAHWRSDMAAVLADTLKWANQPKPRVLIMHMGRRHQRG
jgi:iron complex transport system substrate-binding protein